MIKVKRMGHATLATRDIEKSIDYWTQVMGLQLIERDSRQATLATRLGQLAIGLQAGPEAPLKAISFQVDPGSDLDTLAAGLGDIGIKSEMRNDIAPGVDKAIVFPDLNGTLMQVFETPCFYPVSKSEVGIDTLKLGHVAYRIQDMQKNVDFYCDVLGFRVSDMIGGKFAFLRCGVDHHSINFARFDEPALHHLAFEVKDWAAVQRGCEIMLKNQHELVWGPLRHVVGHNIAAYHRNADDLRIEIYCEMDMMKDEALGYWEPRPWHEEVPLRPKTWPEMTPRSAWGFGSVGNFPGYY